MTGKPQRIPPAENDAREPAAEERADTVRRRLAEGYYRRPEILDRIAEAIHRALGGRS